MAKVFFPGCKVELNYPEASRWLKNIVAEYDWADETAGCCRVDWRKPSPDDSILCVCNNCMAMLDESAASRTLENLWVRIDNTPDFPLPDYQGKTLSLQDCGRVWDRVEVLDAVRSILAKMNINVIELPDARDKSVFCGISFLKSAPKLDAKLAPKRYVEDAQVRGFFNDGDPSGFEALMKEHCAHIPTDEVICYCVACDAGLEMGGKKAVHLLDLVAGTA